TVDANVMRKGAIVVYYETIHSIKSAVEQAEQMVWMNIEHVIVAVNGNQVQLHPCHGVVAVQDDNRDIDDEDITRAIDGAQVMSIPPAREIIDVTPRQFIVDGLDEIKDTRAMRGCRLKGAGTIITW